MKSGIKASSQESNRPKDLWAHLQPESMRRLLDAALECFSELGFHGTTTRAIATRADLSPAAIYIHYKSKSALLQLIMRESHEALLEQMTEASKTTTRPIDQLRCIVETFSRFHATHVTAARVANHELPALSLSERLPILERRQAIEQLVENVLERGMASGDFEIRDLRLMTFAILSLGIGISRWFQPEGRLAPDALGQLYGELVVRMVASPNVAPIT